MKVVQIDRRRDLPYEEFAREYLFPNKPVIVSGAIESWKALDRWTPEYFKNQHGSVNLSIDGENYTMVDFIDRVNSSTVENPAPYLFPAAQSQTLMETGFLDRLANQLRVNKTATCRRAFQRILVRMKEHCESGKIRESKC
jgi:hypothetical protein